MKGMRYLVGLAVSALFIGRESWGAEPHRFILTPKAGISAAEKAAALSALEAESPGVRAISSSNRTGLKFEAWVAGSSAAAGAVFHVEEDFRIKWIEAESFSFQAVPLPSFEAVESGLPQLKVMLLPGREFIPWGVRRVNAPAAWPVTEGAGVKVGIVDTGVDTRNPDLDGQVLGGFNALANSSKETDYQDDNGHGTHVAGTIAAIRGNGWGVVGVAPRASLYAVKVLDKEGSGTLSGVVDGIIWCVNHKMQVINMSLGAPIDSESLHEAVQFAEAMGVVVVAAAGNSGGKTGFPAAYKEAISVSASTWRDSIADFSSRGKVDFIAPGEFIVSLAPGREIANMSGTSMAAPHVTGLAALAASLGARGLQGPDGVYEALKKAATVPAGLDASTAGSGMIDAGKLVQ